MARSTFVYVTTADGDARRNAVLNLLTLLKQNDVPIHALGIEAHLETRQSYQFNAAKFTTFVDAVAGLGLKVFISELDVADNGVPADPLSTRDQIVADTYYDFLQAALANGKIGIVGTWDYRITIRGFLRQNRVETELPADRYPSMNNLLRLRPSARRSRPSNRRLFPD